MKQYYGFILLFLFQLESAMLCTQDQTVGTFYNDSSAVNGYTLFSPVSDFNTYLVDNCGRKVAQWSFTTVPGMMAYLLPNGQLLRAGRLFNGFGAGGSGGLIELRSWEDESLWQFEYSNDTIKQHHDLEYLDNGNVLLIAWERRPVTDIIEAGRIPESIGANGVWMEQIVEIRPIGQDSGEIVWEWHLYDHLVQDRFSERNNFGVVNEHPESLDINYRAFNELDPDSPGASDWVHLNAIDYNPDLDLIVISSRNTSEIYVIDHSTSSEEAAGHTGGNFGRGGDFLFRYGNPAVYNHEASDSLQVLFSQHDASWIQRNGNYTGEISIFNNGLGRDFLNTSSVDIIRPVIGPDGFEYDTTGQEYLLAERRQIFPTEDYPFSSARISGAQVLDDGHVLVTSGNNGTIYELNEALEPVWKYVNPVSQIGPVPQGSSPFLNDIFRSLRYLPGYDGLQGRDLSPGEPLELNPVDYGCHIFVDGISSSSDQRIVPRSRLYPNPVQTILRIETDEPMPEWRLYDLSGRRIALRSGSDLKTIDVSGLDSGSYFLSIFENGRWVSHKFVKL